MLRLKLRLSTNNKRIQLPMKSHTHRVSTWAKSVLRQGTEDVTYYESKTTFYTREIVFVEDLIEGDGDCVVVV